MVEADLEQQSGLVLRAKPDGERHVFKASQGGSLLGAPRAHAAVLAAWRDAYCITQLRCDQCPCVHQLAAPRIAGLDRLACQKRAEQGKPEPPHGELVHKFYIRLKLTQDCILNAKRGEADDALTLQPLTCNLHGSTSVLTKPPAFHAAKRAKLFAAATDDTAEAEDGGSASANREATGDRMPAPQPRQFRGQRIETPSRPGRVPMVSSST